METEEISIRNISQFIVEFYRAKFIVWSKIWNRLNSAVSTTVAKADIPFNENLLPAQTTIRYQAKWSLWVWCCHFGFIWNVAVFIVDAMHRFMASKLFFNQSAKARNLFPSCLCSRFKVIWKHSPKSNIITWMDRSRSIQAVDAFIGNKQKTVWVIIVWLTWTYHPMFFLIIVCRGKIMFLFCYSKQLSCFRFSVRNFW